MTAREQSEAAKDFSYLFTTPGARVPKYMRPGGAPDRKLTDNAKCGLGDSIHFSSRARNGGGWSTPDELGEQGIKDQAARKVCNGSPACPVRARCLLWALQSNSPGVAGGVVVTTSMLVRYRKGRRVAAKRKEDRRAAEA